MDAPTRASSSRVSRTARACWGDYREGLYHGWGTLNVPGKYRYDGEFQAGKRHGRGTAELPDGRVLKGQWNDDKLIQVEQE
jgi:hypothetical protein